jgi:hypothetical protein
MFNLPTFSKINMNVPFWFAPAFLGVVLKMGHLSNNDFQHLLHQVVVILGLDTGPLKGENWLDAAAPRGAGAWKRGLWARHRQLRLDQGE